MMFFKGKQKLIKILTAALVLLTAVSICIAGYTFARYSTSAGGTGTSAIALWNVNISPKTTTTTSGTYDGAVTFGKLSPGDALTSSSSYYNSYIYRNTTNSIDLATVTYQTDVDVAFTIETSDFTIYFNDGSSLVRTVTGDDNNASAAFTITRATDVDADSKTIAYSVSDKGTSETSVTDTNVTYTSTDDLGEWDSTNHKWTDGKGCTAMPSYKDIAELFTVDISYSGSISGDFTPNVVSIGSYTTGHKHTTTGNWAASANTELTINISGSLVWGVKRPASASASSTTWATYLCDWVGKYVDSVSYTFTYSARQASEAGE